MAFIENNPFGKMRGSMGPLTFTSNRAGSFMRLKKPQFIPKALMQSVSQSCFGGMSSVYKSISSINKANWKTFANTIYVPLNRKSTKLFSGFQAFNSINTSAMNSNKRFSAAYITKILWKSAEWKAKTLP